MENVQCLCTGCDDRIIMRWLSPLTTSGISAGYTYEDRTILFELIDEVIDNDYRCKDANEDLILELDRILACNGIVRDDSKLTLYDGHFEYGIGIIGYRRPEFPDTIVWFHLTKNNIWDLRVWEIRNFISD